MRANDNTQSSGGHLVMLPRDEAQKLLDCLDSRIDDAVLNSPRKVPIFVGIGALRAALATTASPDASPDSGEAGHRNIHGEPIPDVPLTPYADPDPSPAINPDEGPYDCGNLGWCQAPGRCTRHDEPSPAIVKDAGEVANVAIWSGEHRAYWRRGSRGEGANYTLNLDEAGIWTRNEATRLTSHCGPEKLIALHDRPALSASNAAQVSK